MRKKIISIILSICIFACTGVVGVQAKEVYKKETVQTIAPGITMTKVDAFYSGYDLTYTYITADLSDEDIDLTLLKSEKGINERETVKTLANTEENVVAAINADFFSMSSDSFSQGIEYKDGRLLQSPIDTNAFAGGFLYGDELVLSNIDFHIMVVAPNLEYREVYRVNKPMSLYGALLMYTADYEDGYSPAPGDGVVEMIVENDVVIGFNRTKEPVKIPEDGYVLLISEMDDFISANFKEGDEVKVEKYITPTLDELTMAFGGGSLLLKDGNVCQFTNNVTGNNPRSAIGTDESGTKIYFLAVDGRQNGSRGVTQSELATLMKEIGCVNALNLDGGGSSNMVAKTWENAEFTAVNRPVENRKVINALGIKSYAKGNLKPKQLHLEADMENVFKGGSVSLKMSAVDNAYTYVDIDMDVVKFNTKLVKEMEFSSDKGGRYEIYATYKGIRSNSVFVNVVEEISGIDIESLYSFEKAGDSKDFKINVFDDEGRYISAPHKYFDITITGDAAEFKDGKIIAKKPGEAVLKVRYGDLCSFARITVDGDMEENEIKPYIRPMNIVDDEYNKSVKNPDKTFVYTALADNGNTLFSNLYAIRLAKDLEKFDRVAVLGDQGHLALDDIYAMNYDKYMCLEKDGALFISLPSKSGLVRSSDSSAFDKIASDIKNATSDNVFITTDGYLDITTREFEVLTNILKENGKKAFFIQRGDSNSVRNINGAKVFYVSDDEAFAGTSDAVRNLKRLKFEIKDGEVYYSFENIFELKLNEK